MATSSSHVNPKVLAGTTIDRSLAVNAIRGASNILAASRRPKLTVTSLGVALDMASNMEKIDLTIVDTTDPIGCIKLQLLSRLYFNKESQIYSQIVSVILSSLGTIFSFVKDSEYLALLKGSGFSPVITTDANDLIDDVLTSYPDLRDELDTIYDKYQADNISPIGLGCLGMILVATGKFISTNNRETWDAKRFRAFSRALGFKCLELEERSISIYAWERLTNFLTNVSDTRIILLRDIKNSAERNKNGSIKKLCEVILTNLRWYQMGNIYLITEVLLKNHTYLLLWGNVAKLLADYELAIRTFPEFGELFPYAKYMNPQLDSKIYNSDSVQELAAICKYIAVKSGHATFNNFITGYKGTLNESKIDALYELANCGDFAWAEYIKESILPSNDENKEFYQVVYSKSIIEDIEDNIHSS